MLTLVFAGIVVVSTIFCWPVLLPMPMSSLRFCAVIIHTVLLVYCDFYFYINRGIFYPLRFLLMPIVIAVVKSEAIKEKADTWYLSKEDLPETDSCTVMMQTFPKNKRRDIKKKLRCYLNRGITATSNHCNSLSLKKDIPVLIDHEREAVRGTNKVFLEEFIKRFLVVFMLTDGYIDRYYAPDSNPDVDKPVALCVFVKNGSVLQVFMYFCRKSEKKSGIWHHHIIRMMLRVAASRTNFRENTGGISSSLQPSTPLLDESSTIEIGEQLPAIEYVNFQVHQDFAKKCAGAKRASWEDMQLMNVLYPNRFFERPPKDLIKIDLDIPSLVA